MFDYLSDMWALATAGNKQGIVFYIALYALVVLGYSALYQFRTAKWPSTRGVLLVAGIGKWGATEPVTSDQEYKATALYRYRVGEVDYEGSRVSPWLFIVSHNARFILKKQLDKLQRNDDGSIEVFFNPGKPHKSFLIKPGPVGLALTLCLALSPALVYWMSYHA